MNNEHEQAGTQPATNPRKTTLWVAAAVIAALLAAPLVVPTLASAAKPEQYQRGRHDHPLALLRYVLYPAGAALEYGLLRPLHLVARSFVPPESCFGEARACAGAQAAKQSYQDRRR